MHARLFCVLLLVSTLALGACSFSKSSSSPFRWSSASSKSSSGSSGGGEEAKADQEQSKYQRDVMETTAAVVSGGGGATQIMRSIGDVAVEHGVTDWESEPETFKAIGQGLKGISTDQFELLSESLSNGSEVRKRLLFQGYSGAQ